MKIIYINLLILFMAYCNIGHSQTEDFDFTLTSSSMSEETEISISSTFTKSGNSLSWSQEANGNSSQKNFTIDSVSGNWDQETSTGNIIYNATLNGYQVRFSIFGDTSSGISATLEILESDLGNETFNVNVINLTYQ